MRPSIYDTRIDDSNYVRLTPDKICDQGVINLLEGFIRNVSNEFIISLDLYKSNRGIAGTKKTYESIRNYILSKDFTLLTGLDGEYVVEKLERMYREGYRVAG